MKLISINVSLAVEVEHNNKIISTGIFKKPVNGDILVGHQGLFADQQADLKNHGGEHKAVYAFSEHHYDYWRERLNKPELTFGQFGENLTISNLDEASLCIGDRLQISDCILEITQPRVPCFKLGIALDLAEMPKLFVQYGATGIYFRVIKTGNIANNNAVKRIYQHPKQLPVQTLFKAYFDNNAIESKQIMMEAAEIMALSSEWREKVLSKQ